MKRKLLMGIGTLLVASSTMFAGWGISVGVGGYYPPPRRVYVAPPYRYAPYYARPYVAIAAPPVYPVPYAGYVAAPPPPYYGAIWIAPHWVYGPHGRYWAEGRWGHRR